MFVGIKMRDDIPTKEDFIRNSIDLDRSKGWELISASTIMKNEFKYSGAKFEIVQSYLHAIDILSNPSYNGSYNQNLKIVSLRSVWIPFLFLCRQAVELSLKNALELTNIEIKGPTHNIKELWDIFVKENKTYIFEGEQCFIKRISVLVDVLDSLDNDGSHFRYSTSNNNNLYREKPYLINPKQFSDEVHSMALTLNCIDVSLFIR